MSFRALYILLVSLTLTIALPSAKANEESQFIYVVQPADSLLEIGLFYGKPAQELVSANDTEPPINLYTGQELTIPIVLNHAVADKEPPGQPPEYIVQRGDTLFRIATRLNVRMDALAAANNILWVDRIYIGQVLQIPGADYVIPAQPQAASLPPEMVPQPNLFTGKQIIVVLSQQRVYAFENGELMRYFIVSTGLPRTPTVKGDYAVYVKLESDHMTGPGYDLLGVPWVMYFYRGYALHGTYWHNNFGHPMSHGCVNMRTPEAEWLYQWAPMGTAVRVIE